MDISLINSQSLLRLLNLTERKEALLQLLDEIDAEIIKTFKGGISAEVVKFARPTPAEKTPVATASIKSLKITKRRTMITESRARISAATKARWAARRADKDATVVVAPKADKPAKRKRRSGLTPEGRARLAANMKARWAARKAGKTAAKVGKLTKKGFKLPKNA
jgi:hypothetical protein